ncbi:MAG: aminotransferase class I/II-fold pyridoxal phosphate-dependent enzyme [Erysipelotrichales bacterium]|nr:aminotransferase class I/II-fold pyridoxal phosphate-dependent enzyme [Erysipelotrichales bacterium]
MLKKSEAIDRLLRENPELGQRRFGLPDIGKRIDGDFFNPTVQAIADAIDFYGYEVRDELITVLKDIDLGGGNPTNFKPFPLSIKRMKESLDHSLMFKYPYTEGDDNIRKILLDYVEELGFINDHPYSYEDIDDKGLCVHNITFLPSTSIAFNYIINIIAKPGDVILIPGPNYGLFTIRAERAGAEVEILPLSKEDKWLVNPEKLAAKIDDINESLQKVYNRRKGYVPRVVAFLNTNPSNPTGKVMGESEVKRLEAISKVCLERGTFVIDDLVYRDLVFDEKNIAKPISTIPGSFRNTISLFGLSKSYGLASLRAGFVVADEIIIRELINRIFQGMDSAPDIVGQALAGAYNITEERKKVYNEYFTELRDIYRYKYNLLVSLVSGIDAVDPKYKERVLNTINSSGLEKKEIKKLLEGMPYVEIPENLIPDAGFFVMLDFTKIKGMKYKGSIINTERDLLKFFYKTCRIRFLIGQSISWPNEEELIGRVTFALEDDLMINAFKLMSDALTKLMPGDEYMIRKNRLEDQEQMAHIKVDGWRNAYDNIVSAKYLKSLDYQKQTERYIASFEEYKDLVIVAVKGDEVLGYSCYDIKENEKYDSELVSLYIKPDFLNKGIGSSLLKETAKILYERNCKNMIIWCFKDNENAKKFYKELGGNIVEEKVALIGDESYEEVCFYFDLEFLNENPF